MGRSRARWPSGRSAGSRDTWAARRRSSSACIERRRAEQAPIALDEHYSRAAWIGAAVDDEESVDIRAGGDATPKPRTATHCSPGWSRPATRLGVLLAETSPDRAVLVPWQGWALRRDDFLAIRMMEITVHSDDLAASVGVPAPELPDEVLGPVLGLLTRLAVRRHGQSAVVAALSRAERAPARINAF